ncbi:TonB-dependent siderophore receptor [Paracraurococcus ruber]|uniref:TonB-dependent siderophore receptor n=1 Tax=Paracraurococcus ruber TaxID=77675 RepID=A0ABS1CV26_9PROT|nr:TonB-dependent siderophore receptor [Paracraurococcus ruber]MBK1658358.1 TonB-dependent siderophore receptor [Paracraurococcus ruber]TDG30562.1 TonB-dependent siderophore receptor [Paracraurococcus ruber]
MPRLSCLLSRPAALIVLVFAAPAMAQDGTISLPEIDVSGRPPVGSPEPARGVVATEASAGTKSDAPLREVPQSVSVVPRATVDLLQAQTLGEAVRYQTGLRAESYGPDPRADFLLLRGFDAVDNGLYLDGLRYSVGFAAGSLETYGLERFEILRGPASVLYGQIQPGGLVNQVSRRPTLTPQGEMRLSAGSHGRLQAAGTSSGPLTRDGSWSYSLTALGRLSDTQVDEINADRAYLAPALTWRPDNDTRLTLLAYYQRDRTQGAQFLPYLGTVRETAFGRIPTRRFVGEPRFDKYDITQWGLGSEFERRLGEAVTIRQNLRWSHSGINWRQTVGTGLLDDERTLSRIGFVSNPDIDRFQVDNQADVRFRTGPLAHTLLAGFDYSTVRISNPQAFGPAPSLDVFRPAYGSPVPLPSAGTNTRQSTAQYGLYAQDQVRLGERWVLTAGLRQDWVDSSTLNRIAGGTERQNDSATTARVGLVYLAANGLAPYASWSTSFLPTPGTDIAGRAFRPRSGEQFEAGVKYQPPGLDSFVQAAAFQITQADSLTTDPSNALFQVQTGEIRVRGVEFEGVAALPRGLNLIGSVTYLNAEITKGAPQEVGNRPAGVPAWGAGLYADKAFGEEAGRIAGLGLGAGIRFLGNSTTGNAAHDVVPSVTLMDAALRYDLGRLGRELEGTQVAVTANNLFDTAYVSRCTSDTACFYGNRRTVLASLVKRW